MLEFLVKTKLFSTLQSSGGVMNSRYKNIVSRIAALPWITLSTADLLKLMVLAYYSAREFAESLQIAAYLYPEDEDLQEMMRGELGTENLRYEDYARAGDHADFLEHFLYKYGVFQMLA